jgi:MYXO-CTERM domain-containing protein
MLEGANGLPDPTNITTLVGSAEDPVDLVVGPGGDLYYVDHSPSDSNGAVRRIQFFSTNQPPTAVLSASATNGAAPLAVQFDGAGSTDPDPGDALTYAWDLDGDGAFDDSTSATPTFVYAAPGNYTVSLQVTDGEDATSVAQVVISADNTPPTPTILSPINADTWAVGDTIALEGEGSDTQDGALGGAAMTWDVVLYHCPDDCHQHPLSTISGQSSASFVAPDHEYPSYLEVHLTVTDSLGLTGTTSVILEAEATELTFETVPAGLEVTVGASSFTAPVEVPLIIGSLSSISVASPQELGGVSYVFDSWSDGGPQTHNVVAPAAPASFTVTFAVDGDEDGVADGDDVCPVIPDPDQLDSDADGRGDACDNCIDDANADQADGDTDLTGDVCDNCLEVANADQADGDGDEDGDLCDNCVDEPNADQADGDDDGIGDACEQSGQGGAGGTGGAGGGGGRGSGGAATGGAAAGGAASAGAGTGGSTSATATGTGGKEEPDPDGDEGCGCRVAGAPAGSSHAGVALLGLLALSLKRLRRRGGARRARSMLAGR